LNRIHLGQILVEIAVDCFLHYCDIGKCKTLKTKD
jgi:hypothetical protein